MTTFIFDIGGVLKNNTGPWLLYLTIQNFLEKLPEEFNIEELDINLSLIENCSKENMADLEKGEIKTRKFWKRIHKHLPEKFKSYISVEEMRSFWKTLYSNSELVKINKEIQELIIDLKKSGYQLLILSNTIKHHAKCNREERKLFDNFDGAILSCEVGFRKPEIEIYELVLEKFELKPEECIFIDDKEENLIPAKKLGMNTILFNDPLQLKNELTKMGILQQIK
jgi:epoxide hydrolase-like predicted phosphatase